MVHDMYLVEVKKPEESHYPWDYYKIQKDFVASSTCQAAGSAGRESGFLRSTRKSAANLGCLGYRPRSERP
jgi:hypothetical protein